MSKTPPVPPDQRSQRDPRPDTRPDIRTEGDGRAGRGADDLDHRGESANIRQNTSHSGNVQDR
ncbi:MAG TPA: hypothetical protein VGL73_02825 [Caulobacteraceae bacterium]|jgi:hypothetical protein